MQSERGSLAIQLEKSRTLRMKAAAWAPGILLTLWALLSWKLPWFDRVVTAGLFGALGQVFLLVLYWIACAASVRLLEVKADLSQIADRDWRTLAAILLAASLYVWIHMSRNASERRFDQCVANATAVSPLGQFGTVRELVWHCRNSGDADSGDE